ncbi:uncharacterized protein RCC_07419 [Ramularia collo-cygni]|uniref:Xylanolytic transcriptional activator regulatory domain-containing protein n=1 Tax=Ramularia collo-cygni TaxID=112498 RepID=A0A2D3VCS9_9PEZI|nr:uncharacterized protein RCC_07419 [Ramularia collo-cygni]CZT21556.1 uncharacterized protein RCC_07419 [Ramularia collo-cygni]
MSNTPELPEGRMSTVPPKRPATAGPDRVNRPDRVNIAASPLPMSHSPAPMIEPFALPKPALPFLRDIPQTPSDPNHSIQHTSTLWQYYLDKVDPILKIIDTSAVQHLFISQISFADIPKDLQSLKSAVLFAAASSMQRPLGTACPIADALMEKHARETEEFLAASRFMAQPTIVSLQALTIYLACGSRSLEQTYMLSLTAILVRLAMALKLHRDPESQGLPFSDCEYRRRLWWHICTLDANTSEDNNSDALIYERQCTTRVPEWSTDPNCPEYLKNMFYSAVQAEITYYSRTVLFSAQFMEDNGYPVLPTEGKLCVIEALEDTLKEKYFRRCDRNMPTYRLALTSSKITIARMKIAMLYNEEDIESALNDEIDLILRACVEVMEGLRSFRKDPSLSVWAWLWQSYVDWDAAAIALTILNRTNSCSSEILSRAVSATESFFDSWSECLFEPSRQEQWARLNHLRNKAKVPQPYMALSKRSSRASMALTLPKTPVQLQIHSAPMDTRRMTLPNPIEPASNGTSERHRRNRLSGDSLARNWSMPICATPKADEMHFDLKALDLHDITASE